MEQLGMEHEVFRRFCELAHAQAGIELRSGKEALVEARVRKRVQALGLPSARAYLEHLEHDSSHEEIVSFLDAISTNYTSFFREPDHFELLREALRGWLQEGQRRFRLWSAAASSGEEPYSMAITVHRALLGKQADVRILGTDISTRVLKKARAAVYPAERLENLDAGVRSSYFARVDDPPDHYAVRPEVRRLVVLRRLNLSQPPFPMRGPFDVIFCRNVLIYFGPRVRGQLVAAIEELLRPGGWLCVGHTETLNGIHTGLKMLRPSVFFRPPGGARP
jgi:chemotaxis protein methyltransferase CheR